MDHSRIQRRKKPGMKKFVRKTKKKCITGIPVRDSKKPELRDISTEKDRTTHAPQRRLEPCCSTSRPAS
jgi:hypothetical protein